MSVQSIRSLLIPLKTGKIILPGAVVAEILQHRLPDIPLSNGPAWALGSLIWRNCTIPMLDFEQLNGLPQVYNETSDPLRLVVIYGLQLVNELPFYAFTCQGMPNTVMVTPPQMQSFTANKHPGLLGTVTLGEETIWLPDVQHIENLLAQTELMNNT